jgi:flp/fap pilin component
MKDMVSWLSNEESGQGLVEYALILALIAVIVIAALSLLGQNVNNKFDKINNAL